MIGSWEIEQLDSPDLFHDLALAYLDMSLVATRTMVYGSFSPSFSHSRVVLSMAHHATELFLKGAILRATGEKKRDGHDLKNLYKDYEALYSDEDFHFRVPFSIEYIGFTQELEPKNEPSQDQMFRYHTDRKGEKWKGDHGFEAKLFLQDLESLKKTFSILGVKIHCKVEPD